MYYIIIKCMGRSLAVGNILDTRYLVHSERFFLVSNISIGSIMNRIYLVLSSILCFSGLFDIYDIISEVGILFNSNMCESIFLKYIFLDTHEGFCQLLFLYFLLFSLVSHMIHQFSSYISLLTDRLFLNLYSVNWLSVLFSKFLVRRNVISKITDSFALLILLVILLICIYKVPYFIFHRSMYRGYFYSLTQGVGWTYVTGENFFSSCNWTDYFTQYSLRNLFEQTSYLCCLHCCNNYYMYALVIYLSFMLLYFFFVCRIGRYKVVYIYNFIVDVFFVLCSLCVKCCKLYFLGSRVGVLLLFCSFFCCYGFYVYFMKLLLFSMSVIEFPFSVVNLSDVLGVVFRKFYSILDVLLTGTYAFDIPLGIKVVNYDKSNYSVWFFSAIRTSGCPIEYYFITEYLRDFSMMRSCSVYEVIPVFFSVYSLLLQVSGFCFFSCVYGCLGYLCDISSWPFNMSSFFDNSALYKMRTGFSGYYLYDNLSYWSVCDELYTWVCFNYFGPVDYIEGNYTHGLYSTGDLTRSECPSYNFVAPDRTYFKSMVL